MGPPRAKKSNASRSKNRLSRPKTFSPEGSMDTFPTVPTSGEHYDSSLFWVIENGKASISLSVSNWLKSYEADSRVGVFNLIHTIFRTTGCKTLLTLEKFNSLESHILVKNMADAYMTEEQTVTYLINRPGKEGKTFAATLSDFFYEIVHQTKKSVIFDGYLISMLIDFLCLMANTMVRSFRHTASFIGLKLITSLVSVKADTLKQLQTSNKQLATAKLSKKSDYIEILEGIIRELNENLTELNQRLHDLLHGCFVTRFRDSVAEIRVIAMKELANWMTTLPSAFNSHYKYIKNALIDQVTEVRLEAILLVEKMTEDESRYEDTDFQLFMHTSKDYFVSRILDKDLRVAVSAINVLSSMLQHFNDKLTDQDVKSVIGLMYTREPIIASAAGQFYLLYLQLTPNNTEYSAVQRFFRSLIDDHQFCLRAIKQLDATDTKDYSVALVSTLSPLTDLLTEWKVMTDMITSGELPAKERSTLIAIMASSAQYAANGPRIGSKVSKPTLQKLVKQRIAEAQRMTYHFLKVLRDLFLNYKDPLDQLALLRVAYALNSHLCLEQPKLTRHLVCELAVVFQHSNVKDVCLNIVQVWEKFCSHDNHASLETVRITRDCLQEKLENASRHWQLAKAENRELDEDSLYQLSSAMLQMSVLNLTFRVCTSDIYNVVFLMVKDAIKDDPSLPNEVHINAMAVCYSFLLWLNQESGKPDDETKYHRTFFIALRVIITNKNLNSFMRIMAMKMALDFLSAFCLSKLIDFQDYFSKMIEEIGRCLVACVFVTDYDAETSAEFRSVMIGYWKLIHSVSADGSEAFMVFLNYTKMNFEHKELTKEIWGQVWGNNMSRCMSLIVGGLKAAAHRVFADPNDSLHAQEFKKIRECALDCSKWLNSTVELQTVNTQFYQCVEREIEICQANDTPYVFEVLTHFVGLISDDGRRKLSRKLKFGFEEDLPDSAKLMLAALAPARSQDPSRKTKDTAKTIEMPPKRGAEREPVEKPAKNTLNQLKVNVIPQPPSKRSKKHSESFRSFATEVASVHAASKLNSEPSQTPEGRPPRRPNACSTMIELAMSIDPILTSPEKMQHLPPKTSALKFRAGANKKPPIASSSLKESYVPEDSLNAEDDCEDTPSSYQSVGKRMKTLSLSPVPGTGLKTKPRYMSTDVIQSVIDESNESDGGYEEQERALKHNARDNLSSPCVNLNQAIRIDCTAQESREDHNLPEVSFFCTARIEKMQASPTDASGCSGMSKAEIQDMLLNDDRRSQVSSLVLGSLDSDSDEELSRLVNGTEDGNSVKEKPSSQKNISSDQVTFAEQGIDREMSDSEGVATGQVKNLTSVSGQREKSEPEADLDLENEVIPSSQSVEISHLRKQKGKTDNQLGVIGSGWKIIVNDKMCDADIPKRQQTVPENTSIADWFVQSDLDDKMCDAGIPKSQQSKPKSQHTSIGDWFEESDWDDEMSDGDITPSQQHTSTNDTETSIKLVVLSSSQADVVESQQSQPESQLTSIADEMNGSHVVTDDEEMRDDGCVSMSEQTSVADSNMIGEYLMDTYDEMLNESDTSMKQQIKIKTQPVSVSRKTESSKRNVAYNDENKLNALNLNSETSKTESSKRNVVYNDQNKPNALNLNSDSSSLNKYCGSKLSSLNLDSLDTDIQSSMDQHMTKFLDSLDMSDTKSTNLSPMLQSPTASLKEHNFQPDDDFDSIMASRGILPDDIDPRSSPMNSRGSESALSSILQSPTESMFQSPPASLKEHNFQPGDDFASIMANRGILPDPRSSPMKSYKSESVLSSIVQSPTESMKKFCGSPPSDLSSLN